jgi:2-alkenal reductase
MAEAMDLKSDQHGVLIGEVVTGGPADKTGLKGGDRTITVDGQDVQVGGDVIVAIDGHSVNNFEAFVAYLANSTTPGQKVTLTILRSGREQQVTVTLGERPAQSEE